MSPRMSFRQYRRLDLFLFAVMTVFAEFVLALASRNWFPEQLYRVSACAALTAIVLMRWGPWAGIHAALSGLVCTLASGANPRQVLIYATGNLLSLAALLWFRLLKKERIRESAGLSILFALSVQLLMWTGRAAAAMLTGASLEAGWNFFTTDALSAIFAMVIVWIARRLDGIFEDQKTYLLRVQREREAEKGGS